MHTSIYMSIMQQNLIDNKEKQNERENVKHYFIHKSFYYLLWHE